MRKLFALILMIAFLACQKYPENYHPPKQGEKFGSLVDSRNGKEYKTVKIGNQIWMAENLDYGKLVPDCQQSSNGVIEKSYYENDTLLGLKYGALYTWDEIMDGELAPKGWRIPMREDWLELKEFLGDSSAQKTKASKEDEIPWDGTNSSGMTVIPGGLHNNEIFGRKDQWAMFWTCSEVDEKFAWFAQFDGFWYPAPPKYIDIYVGNYFRKENAFSIRCIMNHSR